MRRMNSQELVNILLSKRDEANQRYVTYLNKMNQTEQTTANAAWEQNIVFQEVEKPEICKWRDLSQGNYKVLDVEDRGINNYGPKVYVWAPTSLIYAMKHRNRTDYIRHRGAMQSSKGNVF